MDKESEFEITNEQRSLLNAGHGPPIILPATNGFYRNKSDPDFDRKRSVTGSHSNDRSKLAMITHMTNSPARMKFDIGGCHRCNLPEPIPGWNTLNEFGDNGFGAKMFMEANKEKNEHMLRIQHELHVAEANRVVLDDLRRQKGDLERQLALRFAEVEELKQKYSCNSCNYEHLKRRSALLANMSATSHSGGSDAPSDFINLVATGEPFSLTAVDTKEEDEAAMMKSVQCSEGSVEEMNRTPEKSVGRTNGSPLCKKKVAVVSSSSSNSSFEVVGRGSFAKIAGKNQPCDGVFQEFEALPLLEVSKPDSVNVENKLALLKCEIKDLKSNKDDLAEKLEAERDERRKEIAELKEKLNEVIQLQKLDNESDDRILEVTPDFERSKIYDLEKKIDELEMANFKLNEQNVDLLQQTEDLKMTQEPRIENSSAEVDKLHDDLKKERRRATTAEEQLNIERRCIIEMKARVRELEEGCSRQFSQQQGLALNEMTDDLAAENALLRHQIEAYKEDFEVERKDREQLVSQKDSLQRCFETLKSDLEFARQQVRKYENDVILLRVDNNSLKIKLHEVTEELGTLRDQQRFPKTPVPTACAPATQSYALMSKAVVQNTFVPKLLTPPAVKSHDWECKICTFKNPAQRTYCEMCGTHELARSSSKSQDQAVTRSYVPNIPFRKSPSAGQALAPPTSTLLSNLRNYGDIETD